MIRDFADRRYFDPQSWAFLNRHYCVVISFEPSLDRDKLWQQLRNKLQSEVRRQVQSDVRKLDFGCNFVGQRIEGLRVETIGIVLTDVSAYYPMALAARAVPGVVGCAPVGAAWDSVAFRHLPGFVRQLPLFTLTKEWESKARQLAAYLKTQRQIVGKVAEAYPISAGAGVSSLPGVTSHTLHIQMLALFYTFDTGFTGFGYAAKRHIKMNNVDAWKWLAATANQALRTPHRKMWEIRPECFRQQDVILRRWQQFRRGGLRCWAGQLRTKVDDADSLAKYSFWIMEE